MKNTVKETVKTTSPVLLAPSGGVQGLQLRRQRLLNAVDNNPSRALDDRRCHKPDFVRQYFDLCDARALECDRRALEKPKLVLRYAEVGVKLAEKIGNRHLVHRSLDTLAHAHIAVEQPEAARDLLDDLRAPAKQCCDACHAGWLQRHGDYLNEIHEGLHAHEYLNRSLARTDSVDLAGRRRFIRGISHHYRGNRDLALADEVSVLESLNLTSPRGYFLDAVAILAIFLRGAGPSYDEQVLVALARFEDRLFDVKYWTTVRTRIRWVQGQLFARLGDVPRAIGRLDRTRLELLASGPIRHAIAVSADLGLIYCRKYHKESIRVMRKLVAACQRRLHRDGEESDPLLKNNLDVMERILRKTPGSAFDAFVTLRSSLVVPVPGIIAERPGFLGHVIS